MLRALGSSVLTFTNLPRLHVSALVVGSSLLSIPIGRQEELWIFYNKDAKRHNPSHPGFRRAVSSLYHFFHLSSPDTIHHAFDVPIPGPKMVPSIPSRRMGHPTAPRTPNRCITSRSHPRTCGLCHGRQQALREKPSDRDGGGPQSGIRSFSSGRSFSTHIRPQASEEQNVQLLTG